MCHSILSNENAIVDLYANSAPAVRSLMTSVVGGGFLTKFGFPAIDNVGGTWTVPRPDLPLAQAVPTTVTNGLPGGSVQTWHQPDGTPNYVQYWLQTERVAQFVTGGVEYDWAVNGVYHNGTGRGKLTFGAAGSYAGSSNTVTNTLVADPAAVVAKAQSVVPSPDANGFITPGSTITYTLTVSNPTNSVPAANVVVADAIPAGTTYVPGSCAGATCNYTTGPPTVTFNVGTVNAGTSAAPLAFQVTVDNPAVDGGQILNAATISGDGGLAGTSNPVSYAVKAAPAISVTKSATPASGTTVTSGQVITYTLVVKNTGDANTASAYYSLVVTNSGPAAADNAVVTDPAVANFTATTVNCGSASGGAVCPASPTVAELQGAGITIATLPSGGSLTFTVSGTAGVTGSIANTATITVASGITDPDNSNNTSTVNTSITPLLADVAVQKNGPALVAASATLGWTVQITSAGPSAADGTTVTDTLPGAVTGAQVTSCNASAGAACPAVALALPIAGTLDVTIPTLPAGGQVVLTISATAPATAQTLVNTASATVPAGITDTDLANNTGSTSTAVTSNVPPPQPVDLGVAKSGPAAVAVNAAVTYVVTATNAGPATANGAVLTDPVPPGLAGVTWTCVAAGGANCPAANGIDSIGATLGAVPAGGVLTWTVRGTAPNAPTTLTNTVTIAPAVGVPDSNPANDAAQVVTQVQASAPAIVADVLLTKTGPATVLAGAAVSYTLTVMNLGPGTADGSRVTDALPVALSTTALTGCSASNGAACPAVGLPLALAGALDVVVPTLPAGGRVVLTVSGTAPGAGASFANLAVVSVPASVSDPVPGNNIGGPVQTTVVAPDLMVAKSASKGSVAVGEAYSYTLRASNVGSADSVLPTTVTDDLPAGLTLGSVTAGASWSCGTVGQMVSCDRASGLPASAAAELVATLNVTPTNALSGQNVTNRATIVGDGETPSCTAPVVNCASADVGVGLAPIAVSGAAYDDGDGNGIQGGGEAGTDAGGLNVVLTDNAGVVLALSSVGNAGSYNFAGVLPNTPLQLVVTTANPALGSSYNPGTPPLPAGWVHTTATTLVLTTGTTDLTNQNFGLEQLPVAVAGAVREPSQSGRDQHGRGAGECIHRQHRCGRYSRVVPVHRLPVECHQHRAQRNDVRGRIVPAGRDRGAGCKHRLRCGRSRRRQRERRHPVQGDRQRGQAERECGDGDDGVHGRVDRRPAHRQDRPDPRRCRCAADLPPGDHQRRPERSRRCARRRSRGRELHCNRRDLHARIGQCGVPAESHGRPASGCGSRHSGAACGWIDHARRGRRRRRRWRHPERRDRDAARGHHGSGAWRQREPREHRHPERHPDAFAVGAARPRAAARGDGRALRDPPPLTQHSNRIVPNNCSGQCGSTLQDFGGIGCGTWFLIGLTDFKYANSARISRSSSAATLNHGIGGRMGRATPRCLPVRIVLMNCSAVHLPSPVSSGVRFAAKLTPHGPAHAVRCSLVAAIHLPGPSTPSGGGGTAASAGWPMYSRDLSGSGPFGVITFGVWQSLQPPNSARYSPRFTWLLLALPCANAGPAMATTATQAAATRATRRRDVRMWASFPGTVERKGGVRNRMARTGVQP